MLAPGKLAQQIQHLRYSTKIRIWIPRPIEKPKGVGSLKFPQLGGRKGDQAKPDWLDQ